jgi:threonine dehydrogenase-like Zn-dependent dehydrogenase
MTKGSQWDFGANSQFGHEYAGDVVEIGTRVANYRIGDRIAVLPSPACGNCESCRIHANNVLCQNKPGTAMVGFAELARVPANLAVRLPTTLSLADGALIEPLAISLYGVKLARLDPGTRVLVLGGGTVALYAIYWARRLGAGRIVATTLEPQDPRRRDLTPAFDGAGCFLEYVRRPSIFSCAGMPPARQPLYVPGYGPPRHQAYE